MKFTAAIAAAVIAGSAEAFWRMECRGRSGLARIDPLVNPGVASTHAHTIFGSSGMFTLVLCVWIDLVIGSAIQLHIVVTGEQTDRRRLDPDSTSLQPPKYTANNHRIHRERWQ